MTKIDDDAMKLARDIVENALGNGLATPVQVARSIRNSVQTLGNWDLVEDVLQILIERGDR